LALPYGRHCYRMGYWVSAGGKERLRDMREYKEVEFDDSVLYKEISSVMSNAEAREYLAKDAKLLIDKSPCDETKSDFSFIMKKVIDNAVFHGNLVTLVDIDKLNSKTNIEWIINIFQALGYLVEISNHGLWISVK